MITLSKQLALLYGQSGYKRWLLCTLLGALLTLSFAPFFIWPLAIVSLSLFVIMLRESSTLKHAFWDGWWFGLGHFTTGLYWFAHALLTDAEQFAWLIPFAVLGIPAILAFYIAIASWLTKKFAQTALHYWLGFALFWLVMEVARAYLFTGFPWNLLGYVWAASDISIQSASIFGVWGLSLLTVLVCASPSLLIDSHHQWHKKYLAAMLSITAFAIALLFFGAFRIASIDEDTLNTDTSLRIVQGNIAQRHKWDPAHQMNIFRTYVSLSKQPFTRKADIIIWPESALPFIPNEHKWVHHVLADATPKGSYLMTGALRIDHKGRYLSQDYDIFNSFFTFNDDGNIDNYYDKSHLVPFGEYIPFRRFVPFKKLTAGSKDFSEGNGIQTLSSEHIPPFSPLICYEVIFPDQVVNRNQAPVKWLLNITNDAWFGVSTAPYQHLHMSRFRAVEEGVPLIRAANTGISAVIDPYGRIVHALALNTLGVLDVFLPSALEENTIYHNRYGLFLLIGFTVLGFAYVKRANL